MSQSILLIYTGGTIGMKEDPSTGALRPFDFSQILEEMPELRKFGYDIDTYAFSPLIDSSDAGIDFWIALCRLIEENYDKHDGFVVLHGTDTMAYTASAISFMLEDLEKPVVFTGSQLPIGMLRTDGKENLISAIEIAASVDEKGHPRVPEVCICFESQLYRGNRTTKYNAENFRAFRSANYPVLADVGIHIKFNDRVIHKPQDWGRPLRIHTDLDNNVSILKLYPGIRQEQVRAVISTPGLRAIVLETFGSGNAPTSEWFLECIRECTEKGIVILNVSQCQAGAVDMNAYSNGLCLQKAGVVSGYDITTESAVTKLYCLLGRDSENRIVRKRLLSNLRGEISKND